MSIRVGAASAFCPRLDRVTDRETRDAELSLVGGREALVGWTYPSEQCPSSTVLRAESWRAGGEESTVRVNLRWYY